MEEENTTLYERFDDWLYDNLRSCYRGFHLIKDFFPDNFRRLKWVCQRIFRKGHYSDPDLWNLDYRLAQIILPKLVAFRNLPPHGIPMAFCDWDPMFGLTKEEYENDSAWVGGEMEKWLETIDKMIFAFEYLVYSEESDWQGNPTKKRIAMFEKYNIKDPWNDRCEYRKEIVANNARVEEGLLLFAKYFLSLWD